MKSAIENGFGGHDIGIASLPRECPTSSCKWNSYQSLGFCSSIQNISNEVHDWELDAPSYAKFPNGTNINVLPLGLFPLETIVGSSPRGKDGRNGTLWFVTISPPSNNGAFVSSTTAPASLVFDVYMVYTRQIAFSYPPVAAAKVTIFPCVLTLQTSTSNTEVIGQDQTLSLQYVDAERYCGQIDANSIQYCAQTESLQNLRSYPTRAGLSRSADVNYNAGGDDYYYGKGRNVLADLYPSSKNLTAETEADIKGFETRMESIALEMTNSLMVRSRQNSTTINTTLVEGRAPRTESYYKVELYWLAMPVLIWLLCSILLCSTLALSPRGSCPIWKSSPLVLLDCKDRVSESLNDVMDTHKDTCALLRPVEHARGAWRLEAETTSK